MQNNQEESQSGLKLTVILLFLFTVAFLAVLESYNSLEMNLDNPRTVIILKLSLVLGSIIFFILPSFLFVSLWTKAKIPYLGITTKPALSTLIIAGVGIILAQPMINWLGEVNQHMHLPEVFNGIETWMQQSEEKGKLQTDTLTAGTTIDVLILNLIVIGLMAAFSEEVFFRGVLQKVLNENFINKHVGVWVGAALFSAIHLQFYGFLPRMLMGAYLGYLFLWSGSLWPGIFAHFINNGLLVFVMWLSNRGAISMNIDKVGIQENEWVYVLISFGVVAMSLWLVYRQEKTKIYH